MEKESEQVFILRPHPSISIDQYKALIENIFGKVPENILFFKITLLKKWMVSCERFY